MRMTMCLLAACLLVALTVTGQAGTAEPEQQQTDIRQLQQQVNELTELIREMKKQHDEEIAGLKTEIEKL